MLVRIFMLDRRKGWFVKMFDVVDWFMRLVFFEF